MLSDGLAGGTTGTADTQPSTKALSCCKLCRTCSVCSTNQGGTRRGGSEQAEKVVRVSRAIGMASFSGGTSVGAGSILRCVRRNVSKTWLLTKRSSARNLFGEADISHFEILSAF